MAYTVIKQDFQKDIPQQLQEVMNPSIPISDQLLKMYTLVLI